MPAPAPQWQALRRRYTGFLANLNLLTASVAFGSAFLAGAINSVAGGGTLLSFPTLIWLGLDSVTANATSTVAIWPARSAAFGAIGGNCGEAEPRFRILIVPSLVGGLTGALLLRWTPPATFDHLVPYLILFATLLLRRRNRCSGMLKTAHTSGTALPNG